MTIQDIVLADLVSWLHARKIRIERNDSYIQAPYEVRTNNAAFAFSRRFATVQEAVAFAMSVHVGGTNEG